MSEQIQVFPVDSHSNDIFSAGVRLPSGAKAIGEWGPGVADADNMLVLADIYTPVNIRRRGVATRLVQSLARYATNVHPTITIVSAYVTTPYSLRIMQRLFPDALTIYDGYDEPANAITESEAWGRIATWGHIPEDVSARTYGLTVAGSLEGVNITDWEMPTQHI